MVFVCSIKSGKVVVVLSGRFAGRKAIVVKASDDGNDSKKFGHALGKPILLLCSSFKTF
jgi:ribosomal protein L14E/L6E/L27E